MIFDVAFHPAAVDLLINEGGLSACKVGHHIARIRATLGDFGFEDDPSRDSPATGLIGKRGEEPNLAVFILSQHLCLIQKGCSKRVRTRITGLAEYIKEVMVFTIVMDFGRAEMAGQIIPCYRQTITGHLHRRIRSQTIAIVRILIALGDLIDPLTPKITEAMIHI